MQRNTTGKPQECHFELLGRTLPVSAQAEGGNIRLVRGAWINDFLDEVEAFPTGAHDDQVDALSGAFEVLTAQGQKIPEFDTTVHLIRPPFPKIPDDWKRYRSIHLPLNGPHVCLWIASRLPERVWVYHEMFKEGGNVDDAISLIRARSRGKKFEWSIRSEETAEARRELHEREIYTLKPLKRHSPERGYGLVRRLLKVGENGRPSLFIFEDCEQTVRELSGGVYSGTSKEEAQCLECLGQWATKWDLEMSTGSILSRFY